MFARLLSTAAGSFYINGYLITNTTDGIGNIPLIANIVSNFVDDSEDTDVLGDTLTFDESQKAKSALISIKE